MTAKLAGVEDYYPILAELKLQSAVSGKRTAQLELSEKGEFQPKNTLHAEKESFSKKADNSKDTPLLRIQKVHFSGSMTVNMKNRILCSHLSR